MEYRHALTSGVVACSLALLLLSVPSYAFLTNNAAYMDTFESQQLLATLPEELSGEIAEALGGVLFLSPDNTQSVADHISESITATWAHEQGERIIVSVVAYLRGDSMSIDGYIDISVFRHSLLELLYGYVPSFLIDLLYEYVPSELPLSLIFISTGMEGIRTMISTLGHLRYISLVLCCTLGCYALWRGRSLPSTVWYYGVGGSGLLTMLGAFVVRSRILASFNAASIDFIAAYGSLFASEYLHYMLPLLLIAAIMACSCFFLAYRYHVIDKRNT